MASLYFRSARRLLPSGCGAAVLSLCAALPACGSGDERKGAAPPVEAPELGSLSARVVDALCQNQLACPITYDKQLLRAAYFEQRTGEALDNCRAYYATPKTAEEHALYEAAEERGALEIDAAALSALAACQLEIEDDSWLIGKVPPGEPCQLHVECDGGYCDTAAGCPGSCVARKPAGEACLYLQECLSGVCDVVCAERSTTAGARQGETCSEGEVSILCEQGLWCDPTLRTCQRPIAAGAACHDSDDACEPGHICAPLGASTDADREWRCVRVEVQSAGEPCDLGGPPTGDTYRICDLLRVDVCADDVCVHHPEGREGDPCGRTDVDDTCASGFACRDSMCVGLLEDGAECSSSGVCLGRCNFDARRCETPTLYCEEPL